MASISLAEVLLTEGLITKETLEAVLAERVDTGEALGDLLVRLGHITEREKVTSLATLYDVPFLDLSRVTIEPATARVIPHAMASRLKCIPVAREGDILQVAMVNPADVPALDELALVTRCSIDPAIASQEDITEAISRVFGQSDDVRDIIGEAVKETSGESGITVQDEEQEPEFSLDELHAMVEGAPVVRLVNSILSRGIGARASDIHIEPEENRVRVRFRVDGLLQEVMAIPKDLQHSISSRIKVMASMDIAERRSPQDGRITIVAPPNEYDLRISTYPSTFGENVVMRLLDKDATRFGLESLGMRENVQEQLSAVIAQPYGMVLATGPTGCGKTTTLYAAINQLNSVERHIITIEDPVEYQIPGVVQANVNQKTGMTFANGLRTIVRQDPDVIMVGEIRDGETADIAVEAALTGHLVLSTLHAGDAASSIHRIMDMGIPPFLLASSLLAVVSQRLVRIICGRCQVPAEPSEQMLKGLGIPASPSGHLAYYRGSGCHSCGRTGYRGRTGIFEVMAVDDAISDLIMAQAPAAEIAECAVRRGMRTLWDDAVGKVTDGITTIEEVLRVTRR